MIRLHDVHAADRRGGQPTVAEAADFILKHHREPVFRDYRRRCLADWRAKFGDAFADAVESTVKQAWHRR